VTPFEFVFALYSIIISLGITHLLAGFIDLRRATRVQISLPHLLWAGVAFTISIGNWASMWELRLMESWPAWTMLLMIATALAQYVFCAFVTPDTNPGGEVDLVAFHERERRRYIAVFLIFSMFSMSFNIAFGVSDLYADWLRDVLISMPAIGAGVLAFFVKARWAQTGAAALLFGLALFFLVLATNLSAA